MAWCWPHCAWLPHPVLACNTCRVACVVVVWCVLQVYRVTVEPLVHTLFNNGKATCFAYGQTGSGKTYTMSPLPIRAAADILRYLERPELRDVELYVSCFEIYGNKVFDLLNMRKKLNILEDGKKKVCVVGLKVRRPASQPDTRPAQHCRAGAAACVAAVAERQNSDI